jgi:hypothetical protein
MVRLNVVVENVAQVPAGVHLAFAPLAVLQLCRGAIDDVEVPVGSPVVIYVVTLGEVSLDRAAWGSSVRCLFRDELVDAGTTGGWMPPAAVTPGADGDRGVDESGGD